MTVDEIYQKIAKQKPPVIYVSGKTSTGKSTFGRRLHDQLGYQIIELEAILLEIIKGYELDEQATFRKVFYDVGEFEAKNTFFNTANNIISNALANKHPIVIEGAVANIETLQRVLQPAPHLLFLYFHPYDIEIYVRNLTERFMESSETSYGGLPLKFWRLIDDAEFKKFCKTRELTESLEAAIRQYALASQKESLTRLEEFRRKFKNIIVVGIR